MLRPVYDFCQKVERRIKETEKKHGCILCFKHDTETEEWLMSVIYLDGSAPVCDVSLGVCKFADNLRSAIRNWFNENA